MTALPKMGGVETWGQQGPQCRELEKEQEPIDGRGSHLGMG